MPGKLYLIPTTLSEENILSVIPVDNRQIVERIRLFFIEEEKSARRFLKKLIPNFPFNEGTFIPLNEHTSPEEIKENAKFLSEHDAGIISQTGCPCVADPGADLVLWAHQNNIPVIPLVGPSAILLALMASGLNGQNFAFNGYLSREKEERIKKIRHLEQRSFHERQTQIFMETPYRNQNIFEDILANADPRTMLSIALDLNGPQQSVKTTTINEWKKVKPVLNKKPALFLLLRRPDKL